MAGEFAVIARLVIARSSLGQAQMLPRTNLDNVSRAKKRMAFRFRFEGIRKKVFNLSAMQRNLSANQPGQQGFSGTVWAE
jgi:hypothetical protein